MEIGYVQMITTIWLLTWAIEDVRHRSIRTWELAAGGLCMLLTGGIQGEMTWVNTLAGMVPGLLLLLVARMGRKSVGAADGIAVLFLGMLHGFWECMNILLYSLILFGVVAVILLIRKRISRDTRIPFIPFLLAGYWLGVLL